MNNIDVVNLIKEQVRLCGYSQKTMAFNLGISPQYLSDILHYRRELSDRVLRSLGLARQVTYERIK